MDTQKIEALILIDSNGEPGAILNILNNVRMEDLNLSDEEVYKAAADIILSLFKQEYIEFKIHEYKMSSKDSMSFVSEKDATDEEIMKFLKTPQNLQKYDTFSLTEQYVIFSTKKGIDYLNTI